MMMMMMRKKTKRKRMGSRKGEKMNRSGIMGRLENQIKFSSAKNDGFISKF